MLPQVALPPGARVQPRAGEDGLAIAGASFAFPAEGGVVVVSVEPGGPLRSQLRSGDKVVSLDGTPVTSAAELAAALAAGVAAPDGADGTPTESDDGGDARYDDGDALDDDLDDDEYYLTSPCVGL